MFLKSTLPDYDQIWNAEEDDVYKWRPPGAPSSGIFNTAATWDTLHPAGEKVPWHGVIWFTGRIPKHAFLAWIIARDRLITRDRLLRWGLLVPESCVLCVGGIETKQHLFFDYPFSKEVWSFFTSTLHLAPPNSFEETLQWLKSPSKDKNVVLIIRLLFQAFIYFIWKERNSRVHTDIPKQSRAIISEIKSMVRLKLDPLSRAQPASVGHARTYLSTWSSNF